LLLSVVIPAYNEAGRLPSSLDRLIAFFNQQGQPSVEILVVDDGSNDGTAGLVEEYASRHHGVRLLKNPGNRGKGYAVRHGMLDAKGDWVLFTDADLSTPIEELEKLMAAAREHQAAVVLGSRAVDRSLVQVSQGLAREVSGRIFNLMLRLIVGLPYLDTQCGFKLFRADAARRVYERQTLDGFSFDVEDIVIARRLGYRPVEIGVVWRNVEGTKVTLLHGMRSFVDLLRIRWNDLHGRYSEQPGSQA
jgi:glycosyltransferase involved in cell wall biosynthesis